MFQSDNYHCIQVSPIGSFRGSTSGSDPLLRDSQRFSLRQSRRFPFLYRTNSSGLAWVMTRASRCFFFLPLCLSTVNGWGCHWLVEYHLYCATHSASQSSTTNSRSVTLVLNAIAIQLTPVVCRQAPQGGKLLRLYI